MATTNTQIAETFDLVADLLEIEAANPFRVRAYREAARTVRAQTTELADRVRAGEDLSKLPGVGKDLAGKIAELTRTGRLGLLRELERRTPRGLVELLALPGLGPKRVAALREELGIRSRAGLARAVRAGRVRGLPGFGAKTEQRLREALASPPTGSGRTLWAEAEPVATDLVAHLEGLDGVRDVVVAGSFRRRKETVGDLDILVTAKKGAPVTRHFLEYPEIGGVLAQGRTKCSVVLRTGLQVDLRIVPRSSYGAALVYFTGSKPHNVAVRGLGRAKGLKVNEYGVFRGGERVAGRTERSVYRSVGLRYVEPELREDRGELEAARAGRLPELLELEDVRGDLHVHTSASDGTDDIEAMARAARALGYEYLAITDHTRAARIAGGLDPRRLRRQLTRIDRLNDRLRGIRVLRSAEVDILDDGRLDLPAGLMDELDLVVGAVHSGLGKSARKQTERILRAMDDRHLNVLAHPTGRLLGRRRACALDLERVLDGAAERGCAIELNAQPARLDLSDIGCRAAKERGVPISIATDAHSTEQLGLMRVGVGYARRGWLGPRDVLNTLPWRELRKRLRR